MSEMWQIGDRVRHRFNAEMGPGMIVAAAGRRLSVFFPLTGDTLEIAASSDALARLELEVGGRARFGESGAQVTVEEIDGENVRLADGRWVPGQDLWPLPTPPSPLERLRRGDLDSVEDFRNRLDALRLDDMRRAGGLGSFLGGRIRIYPHQFHVAERATAALQRGEAVRWLLADEVGLGKTVEACLIMNRLLHGQESEIERAVVIAPETLTVQWLGELWRKYHQVFVLLDEARVKDVEREHGAGFNPFDVHRRVILSTEQLADKKLMQQALDAGLDLLVLDEAHHLRRRQGHPGNAAYRAFAPLAEAARHVLLLSATPLEDDIEGFFRLLQLLRPDELPETDFAGGAAAGMRARLERREPLPPCTSATRREDIGGLPPREPHPVDFEAAEWRPYGAFLEAFRGSFDLQNPVARKRATEQLQRAYSSPVTQDGSLESAELERLANQAKKTDPRVEWLVEKTWKWAQAGEKTLIFVAEHATLDYVRGELQRVQVGVFHEGLSLERRDVEVARFRLSEGPSVMISTESGGEGRNFEFCSRLVLFDLPWHPATVEQRIGRLDRIGRELPTEIVYFRPPSGFAQTLAKLYESIGIFERPLGGLVRELRHLADAIAAKALDEEAPQLEDFAAVLDEAHDAEDRVREAAYHQLHHEPFLQEMAPAVLDRVPADLDALCEDVVTRAAARFGFACEAQSGVRTWLIEFGSQALLDHLPGVAAGTRFLGTFDRERAVAVESLDFFASGHPLVEGILAELEDGERGRSTFFVAQAEEGDPAFGLLALYRDEEGIEAVAVDEKGELRPGLAERLFSGDVELRGIDAARWTAQKAWKRAVKTMAKSFPAERQPSAVAAFRLIPS